MRTKQNSGKNFLIIRRRLSHTMHRQGAGTAREKELPDADTCILFDIWIHPKRRIVKRRESFSVRKNISRGAGCLYSPPFARLWQIFNNIVGAGFPGLCGTRMEAGRNGRPQGSPLQTTRNNGVGATLAVALLERGRKPGLELSEEMRYTT